MNLNRPDAMDPASLYSSPNRLAPDEYKALHPMGIAPVITDGDLVLGESGAICEYICARHGDGRQQRAGNQQGSEQL